MGERITQNINTKEYWNKKLGNVVKKTENLWRIRVYKFLLDVLPKNRNFSLLDVGCAFGDGVAFLQRYFPLAEFYGLDFSDVGIRQAKRRHPRIKFICADICSYQFQRKYSYITIIRTLEHFTEPFLVLNKCLNFASRCVLLNIPSPKLKCREHVHKFYPDSFEGYTTKDFTKNPSMRYGKTLAVYSKKMNEK